MSWLRRHPSQAQLRQWLDTGGPDEVTAHVDQCERCANALEGIANEGDAAEPTPAMSGRLAQAMSTLWEAPADLQSRVIERVDNRMRAENDLAVIAGLLTIGVETAQLMIPGQPSGARRRDEASNDEGEKLT